MFSKFLAKLQNTRSQEEATIVFSLALQRLLTDLYVLSLRGLELCNAGPAVALNYVIALCLYLRRGITKSID